MHLTAAGALEAATAIDQCRRGQHLGRQVEHGRRHAQFGIGRHGGLGRQAIELGDHRRRGPEAFGDAGHGVALAHFITLDPHALIFGQLQQVLAEGVGRLDGQQQKVRPGRVGRKAVKGRVQGIQVAGFQARQFGGHGHVDLSAGLDRHKKRLVRYAAELQPIGGRVAHQSRHGQQLGHIGARFGRQLQVPEVSRLTGRDIGAHLPVDRHLTAVVGGDGQQPVAVEHVVQPLQIVQRRTRGRHHIATAVIPPVLLESEARTGGRYELPQSGGARAGIGIGLVSTLNDGQHGQLGR